MGVEWLGLFPTRVVEMLTRLLVTGSVFLLQWPASFQVSASQHKLLEMPVQNAAGETSFAITEIDSTCTRYARYILHAGCLGKCIGAM